MTAKARRTSACSRPGGEGEHGRPYVGAINYAAEEWRRQKWRGKVKEAKQQASGQDCQKEKSEKNCLLSEYAAFPPHTPTIFYCSPRKPVYETIQTYA